MIIKPQLVAYLPYTPLDLHACASEDIGAGRDRAKMLCKKVRDPWCFDYDSLVWKSPRGFDRFTLLANPER